MTYRIEKIFSNLIILIVVIVFSLLIFGIINDVQKFKIQKEVFSMTTTEVARCMVDTYHTRDVDTDRTGEYSYHYTKVVDVDVAKCEKIRDVMLSITK